LFSIQFHVRVIAPHLWAHNF